MCPPESELDLEQSDPIVNYGENEEKEMQLVVHRGTEVSGTTATGREVASSS